MLDYSIMKPEGILLLSPEAPLTREDFGGLSTAVNAYLSNHAKLRGVLIQLSVTLLRKYFGWFRHFTATQSESQL